MSITSINNYTTSGASSTQNTSKTSTENSTLDMDDFFQLMVAQLSNQDIYNTVDNTEYINQMAQFSMIQAIADLSEASTTAYSVSLIGKEVAIAQTGSDGSLTTKTGIVEGVTLYNGSAQVVVDGESYELKNIMAVKEPDIIVPDSKVNQTADTTDESSDTTDTSSKTTTDTSTDTDAGSDTSSNGSI